MKVKAAGKSDRGLKRKINEDSILIAPNLGLYVVADGMGGHKAGEIASRMVVETMADYWREVKNHKPPSFLEPVKGDVPESAKHLINSISFTNILIHEAQKKRHYQGMGSTISAILLDDDCMWSANVGDSPIFLYDRGRLIQVSEEHSINAERKSMGLDDASNPVSPLLKNVLTRVLGLDETVNVFITPIMPEAGDLILMCSDGLTNYLSEQSIKDVLDDFLMPIRRKVEVLIELANKGGGGDDVSVILLEVVEEKKWNIFKKKGIP